MKHLYLILCLIPIILMVPACDDDFGTWEMEQFELIGPLMQSRVSLENVTDFHDLQHESAIEAEDVGFPEEGTVPFVPPYQHPESIYMGEFIISDHFTEIIMSEIEVGLRIDNQFPIPIGSGTELVIYDKGTNNVVHRIEIDEEIPPKTTVMLENVFRNLEFRGDVEWYIENFNTPGSDESVTFTSEDKAVFSLEYLFLQVNSVKVNTEADYFVMDTAVFHAFKDTEEQEADSVEGDIMIFIENYLPINLELQFTFLDKDMNVLDSLFDATVIEIEPAELNANTGAIVDWTQQSSAIPFSAAKWNRLRKTRFLITRLRVQTQNLEDPTRILSENSYLYLQLVGDLIINPE